MKRRYIVWLTGLNQMITVEAEGWQDCANLEQRLDSGTGSILYGVASDGTKSYFMARSVSRYHVTDLT